MANKTFLTIALASALASTGLHAQTADDNILITECQDIYTFYTDKDTGKPMVKNRKHTEYLASRMGATVQPAAYYGDFITLDHASAKGSAKAQYKSITPENVFFDDTKVCFFNLTLDRQGKRTQATFERTFKDLRYFTRIGLGEEYFTQRKEVAFIIPPELHRYRPVERNFSTKVNRLQGMQIACTRTLQANGDSVITYTLRQMPALKSEEAMPSINSTCPCLIVQGEFADHNELYRWSHGMAQTDTHIPHLAPLLQEITAGCTTDLQKIQATYAWVQRNIRYIAFEAGLSGHKPDTPANVVRKRYGDCKGMALLLKTLLTAQGFDARLTDIATTDIPWTMTELPTLASANHMICTLFYQGKTYYLDATYEYIPLSYIPQSIQGQEAMIEDGDRCLMKRLPTLPIAASTDSISYQWQMKTEANGTPLLQGTATRHLSGDMKEWFCTALHSKTSTDQQEFLKQALAGDGMLPTLSDITWKAEQAEAAQALLKASITTTNCLQQADDEYYIDLNPHNELFATPIDTAKRIHDYCLPAKGRIVRSAELPIPAHYQVTHLPAGICLHTPAGTLQARFVLDKPRHTLRFEQVMQIDRHTIPRNEIPAWNEALRQWREACNEQVVIASKTNSKKHTPL